MFDSDLNIKISPAIQDNISDIDREFNQNIALSVSELSSFAEEIATYLVEFLSLEISPIDGLLAMCEEINSFFTEIKEENKTFPASVFHTLHSIKDKDRKSVV